MTVLTIINTDLELKYKPDNNALPIIATKVLIFATSYA